MREQISENRKTDIRKTESRFQRLSENRFQISENRKTESRKTDIRKTESRYQILENRFQRVDFREQTK